MGVSKIINRFLIGFFLLFIISPLIVANLYSSNKDAFSFDRIKQASDFPEEFENYFNSNFGLRKFFISSFYFVQIRILKEKVIANAANSVAVNEVNSAELHSKNTISEVPHSADTTKKEVREVKEAVAINMESNKTTSDSKKYKSGEFKEDYSFIAGINDWLFYASANDGYGLDDFKGKIILTNEELLKIKNNITEQRDWLRKRNIQYLVVVCPNKQTIYPEYLPEWLAKQKGSYTVADQLVSYIKKNSDIDIVDLRKQLLLKKKESKKTLYYKTDTHWNKLGAFYAYQDIMKHITIPDSVHLPLSLNDYKINYVKKKGGDISTMVGLEDFYDDVEVNFTVKNKVSPKLGKILFIHDSYYYIMADFFNESFEEVKEEQFFANIFNYKLIEEFKPDIVIYEVVERYQGMFLKDNPSEIKQ